MATWRDRSGVSHTATVTTPQGLDIGRAVRIWIDPSGAAVPEPTTDGQALGIAAITAGIINVAGASVLAAPCVGHPEASHAVLQLRDLGTAVARGRPDLEPRRGYARLRNP